MVKNVQNTIKKTPIYFSRRFAPAWSPSAASRIANGESVSLPHNLQFAE